MKLGDLISVSLPEWISGFKTELEEFGPTKKSRIFAAITSEIPVDDIIESEFGDLSDRSKRSFNQHSSSLYKEFLTHLLISHREYPELLMAKVKRALMDGNEQEFDSMVSILERILTDTENLEMLASLYYLLRDHHYAKITKPTIHKEYRQKLSSVMEQLTVTHSLEDYFFDNDLGRLKKETRYSDEELETHCAFFEQYFGSEHPIRTRICARIFRLRIMFCFQIAELTSVNTKRIAKELFKLYRKNTFLYFNFPELIEFSNISYQAYTRPSEMSIKEFNELFHYFYERFDTKWILDMHPRIYQAMLTTQTSYHYENCGIRFKEDKREIDPEIKSGLERTISLIQRVRDRPSYADQKGKSYGIITEAYCRICLSGPHLERAIEIFNFLLEQEKQRPNAHGKHELYRYLCTTYFLNMEWDKLIETEEKYARFIKVNGQKDESSKRLLEFQVLISKVMLNELGLSAKEIEEAGKQTFGNYKDDFETWVPYSIEHLKLS